MESTIHFIFELIKIAILGTVYGSLAFISIVLIGVFEPESWYAMVSKKKFRLWFICGFTISIWLFLFMMTYWGDHGLGDNAKVPVGHFQIVTHSSVTTIEKGKYDQLAIMNFEFDNDNLYAKIDKEFSHEKREYVVWNLRTDELTFYKNKE
ncbi:MAG: hypothetical protein CVV25_13225 [Ignavibacteriae bacterium HGW-Ignavibacteriae-4]|jgi:hypothetical protein|nr:MAG: hypothetical protein CVV25_13225 [Ignavibacteriae bacterium HGW-Ignavibacteriae-4]